MAVQTALPYVDALTPEFLMATIKERDPRGELDKKYLHRRLFPQKEVPEDKFAWEVAPVGQNWLAGFYSQDGRPVPAGEIDSKTYQASVARIMANYVLDETTVKNLRTIGQLVKSAGEEILRNPIVRSPLERHQKAILDHTVMMDEQLEAQMEYMATSLIQGKLSWPPRDLTTGDYILPLTNLQPYWGQVKMELLTPMPAHHKQNASTLVTQGGRPGGQVAWTNYASANIIKDLDVIREILEETTGLNADNLTMIVGREMWNALAQNVDLLKAMRGNGTLGIAPNMITLSQIKLLMKDYLKVDVIEYNQKWSYKVSNGTQLAQQVKKPFINPNKVIIFPTPEISVGMMATSPAKGPKGDWKAGKFAWSYESEKPPFTTEIGIGINAFPAAQRWDAFFVLDGAN